jgi:large conductance mechanosensitive channel
MGFFKEFKEFAMKGSIVDLAVGVIIGAAFGALVKSVVDDIMTPPLGYLMGGVDFKDKAITLLEAGKHPVTGVDMKAVVLSYGKFLNALIAFFIQAFAIFLVIHQINRLKRRTPPPPPPGPTKEEVLLTEIRDAIRAARH